MFDGMPPDTLAVDLGGGLPAQFRVWPDRVVILPPGSEHGPGMGRGGEQGLVEAFVAQATVEALDDPKDGAANPFCIGLPGAM
jgi:hypothetical protein